MVRPNLPHGVFLFPHSADGLWQSEPPSRSAAFRAVALGGALDPGACYPKKIAMKLHLNRRHASTRKLKRVLVEADGDSQGLLECADEVPRQCGVCRAFDKAPHLPAAGTSPVSSFREKLQAGLLLLDNAVALRAMDVSSECSLMVQVSPKNPLGVRDASSVSRMAAGGRFRWVKKVSEGM